MTSGVMLEQFIV